MKSTITAIARAASPTPLNETNTTLIAFIGSRAAMLRRTMNITKKTRHHKIVFS